MNYQRNEESEYKHILFKEEKKILLGVNKSMSDEEAELFLDSPIISYPFEYWNKYFKLNTENRQIMNNTLIKFEKKEKKSEQFSPYYWKVVADFIFCLYNVSLYDIACQIEGKTTIRQQMNKKTVYDRLDKAKKSKGNLQKKTLSTIREVCAYYLITDDIVKTGRGVMYKLAPEEYSQEYAKQIDEKYTVKAIPECWEKDKDKKLKDVILELTGLKENQLQTVELQIANRKENIENEMLKNLEIFMDELLKKQ